MACFIARRSNVIRGILEPSLVCALEARVVGRGMDRGRLVLDGLPTVLGFHGGELGLLLYFGFKSGCAVGVNRFLCEVVGSAAG